MRLVPLSLLLALPAALLAQHAYTPADIEEGGRLFRQNCVLCHGPDGDQVPGIDLGHGHFRQSYSQEALVKIIQNGIPGTAMPPHNLEDYRAEIILAYLHSIATSGRAASGNGNPASGKAIFEGKGNCTSCHRVNGAGSRVGPDLSDIGALRRTAEIEQSLLDPNAEVLPQNRFYRVVTKQGETITGRLLNLDTFNVLLLDSRERLAFAATLRPARSGLRKGFAHAFLPRQTQPAGTVGCGGVPEYLERSLTTMTRRLTLLFLIAGSLSAQVTFRPHSERQQRAAELAHLLRQPDEPALHAARSGHAAEREEPGAEMGFPGALAGKV